MTENPRICDYEGSDYKSRFWDGGQRSYEDGAERAALKKLMPPTGDTLIEIGAGFGRLADEYLGYERVVLLDFSSSLLREGQAHLGDDPRFIYVAANWYQMPFVDGLFDTITQVRTIHHAENVPALLTQLARIAKPNGDYVLEFAHKRNLKAILRYWLGKQDWNPFTEEPVEFVEMNYDFNLNWLRRELKKVGFASGRVLTISRFRLAFLKRTVPNALLVALDSLGSNFGGLWQLTPSVVVHNKHPREGKTADIQTFFACPTCGTPLVDVVEPTGTLICDNKSCGHQWRKDKGLYFFKEPV